MHPPFLSSCSCQDQSEAHVFAEQGETENQLLELGKKHGTALDVRIARPAFVTSKSSSSVVGALWNMLPSIKVDILARGMVDIALNGSAKEVFENADLVTQGRNASTSSH